ncbi:MAG TPA: hypothetical protein VFC62_03800 [Atopostipes sp.]|nr:hypothetical protein [Atopostipes sp.]
MMNSSGVKLSKTRIVAYQKNAEIIKYLRRNPIIACEELLGVPLMDSQKWILQQSWNTPNNIWTCSRSFGKSFLVSVFSMLKMLLYPNIKIYILSSKGSQAQETFLKLEDIAKQRISSIPSLKDIFVTEIEKASNSDGFVHDKASFRVSVHGGGTTYTLNSVPDNIRGRRANLLIFDESSFCTDELITTALPFITQDSDFKLSIDDSFNLNILKKEIPNQVIFASSAGDIDSKHAQLYKEYGLKMVIGDSNYFSADIPCDIPLNPLYNGEPTRPLLTKQKIDDEMRSNPDKAKREYYNKFQADGGESQIIKWAAIRRNESFTMPQMANHNGDKFVLAFDPARTTDNSILSAMKVSYDDVIGYYGEIVNCTSLMDLGKKKKTPMRSPDQIKYIKQSLLDYNGNARDYENIHAFLVDSGAGGGGISAFADNFLEDWVDDKGVTHAGLIDPTHEQYANTTKEYPNAKRILKLMSPHKYKTQIVEELIELIKLDLIKFPKEYNGKPEVPITIEDVKTGEIDIQYRTLSIEEQVALVNLDIMKSEATSIHSFENMEKTVIRYGLPKDKEKIMSDDRFDTLAMLAHFLYEIRRDDFLNKSKSAKYSLKDYFFAN